MKIKLLSSFKSIENISEEWRDLLGKSRSNSIFLTWEWLYTWAEQFIKKGRELFIIAVYHNEKLIGLAPWYINSFRFGPFNLRRIESLGTPETASDYLDVIVEKGKEKMAASKIYESLMGELSFKWDCFHFRNSPSHSFFFLNFIQEFENDGKYIGVNKGAYCPILELCNTKEEFMASLSANRRQQLRRHYKVLSNGGRVHHKKYTDEGAIDVINRFSKLYHKRWGSQGGDLFQFLEKFTHRTRGKNWVQIDLLQIDNNDIAGIFHLFYQRTANYYLMAVDKNFNPRISIGNILLSKCIQDAIENKLSKYDFLRGTEHHKFHWANHINSLQNIEYYRCKISTAALFAVESLRKMGKILLR
ncbi:MAG: GNAT family N-acetyltransferase [Candidatus Thorarchaeota archaeon]